MRRLSHPIIFLLLAISLYQATADTPPDARHRMDDLVDSMKDAVKEAENANKKREVVDLGQSLHLLETKFAGLRSALTQEMGVKSTQLTSHNDAAKELMSKSGNLVKEIVSQRDELRKLSSDVKEVDSAIRALKYGLDLFQKEVEQLSKIIADVHVSHHELAASHDETKHRLHEAVADSNDKKHKSTHGLVVVILLIELFAFVAYLYFKRPGGALAHKAYGKYG